MVQPKYSPEEALERVKLMMKYDTSKTLNENKEIIFEQSNKESDQEIIAKQILHASDPGGLQNTDEEGFVSAIKLIKTAKDYYNINSYLKKNGQKKDIVELINDEFEYDDHKYVDEIARHLESLGFKVDTSILRSEPESNGRVYINFKNKFKITNSPPANGSSTQPSASANTATNTVAKTAKNTVAKTTANKTGMIYTYCSGTYKVNCKSEVIRKVQGCLSMPAKYQTGNFGPITQGELARQFPQFKDSFTDDDVYKTICKKNTERTTSTGAEDVKLKSPSQQDLSSADNQINNQFNDNNSPSVASR